MKLGQVLAWPFYNRSERRLRLWLRLVLTAMLFSLVDGAAFWAASALGLPANMVTQSLRLVVSVSTTVCLSRWLLDRQPPHLGKFRLPDVVAAFLFAGLAQTVIFCVALIAGWIHIEGTWSSSNSSLLPVAQALGIFICVGWYEELLMRAYLLPNLAQFCKPLLGHWGTPAAWLATAVIFGFAHFLNPHASLLSSILLVAAGVMLGLSPVFTGSIAMAFGAHIGWNWFMGAVFGFAVSGTDVAGGSLIRITVSGPELWTGGAFGPEGGLLGLLGVAVLAGLMLFRIYRRHGELRLVSSLSDYRADWYL